VQGTGCRVQGTGCWVLGAGYKVQGAGYRVQGTGCWVLGAGFWVQGAGYKLVHIGRLWEISPHPVFVIEASENSFPGIIDLIIKNNICFDFSNYP
jgi:hypothetical protein